MKAEDLMPFVEDAAENWEDEQEYAGRMEVTGNNNMTPRQITKWYR